jgi:hypothetical protein
MIMMNRLFRRGEREDFREFVDLERDLQDTLVPVLPDPGYVRDLKNRLRMASGSEVDIYQKKTIPTGVWVAGSVLSGALVLVLGVRGIMALLVILGILHPSAKGLAPEKCVSPVQQAA